MVAQFCDVSQFQGNIDFAAYAAWARQWDGKARMAIKSTEGSGFIDPLFTANRARALAAGIDEIYYYHFARPDLGNSAIAEANFQRQVVGDVRPQDRLILDLEVDAVQATSAWAYTWLVTQQANYGGKLPGIYASTAYIAQRLSDSRLAQFQLWLADWTFDPNNRPSCPSPWSHCDYWQYSDKSNVPGIPGIVDCNIFLGKEEDSPMSISLSSPGVAQYFKANGQTWQCLKTGFLIGGAILDFYKSFGGTALCGLSLLGLPETNEIGVIGHPGVTYQRFERAVVVFDPSRVNDSPPGLIGQVYLAHIDSGIGQDPRVVPLQTQVALLSSQVADLQSQLAGNTLNLENQALLAKIAKAQEALS